MPVLNIKKRTAAQVCLAAGIINLLGLATGDYPVLPNLCISAIFIILGSIGLANNPN